MSNPSMETERPDLGLLQRLRLAWFQLLQSIQHLWIRATVLPAPFEDLELDRDKPICYVIDWYETTSLLILDRVCEEQGLPRPVWPMTTTAGTEPRSYLAMRRKTGLIIRRPEVRRHSETLKRMVENVCEERVEDIQLVPVTILIGRAPDKETGLAKIYFSESWEIGGHIWRFFNSIVNGRHTMVQFGDAVSLAGLAAEGLGPSRTLRKVSRILRVHFQRRRAAAIGPDLSHRRMVLDQVLATFGDAAALLVTPEETWKADVGRGIRPSTGSHALLSAKQQRRVARLLRGDLYDDLRARVGGGDSGAPPSDGGAS